MRKGTSRLAVDGLARQRKVVAQQIARREAIRFLGDLADLLKQACPATTGP